MIEPGKSVGGALWGLAGLALTLVLLTMASVGLVLLPVLLPMIVFVYLLVDTKVAGVVYAGLGALAGINTFVILLALDPPCASPTLDRLPDGTFVSGCAEPESMAHLIVGAAAASVLVGALLIAYRMRRRNEASAAESHDHLE